MVDVGDKEITKRTALASGFIELPVMVLSQFTDGEFSTKKGPVIQTATIAGIMAAKQTSSLIPLCHPLPLSKCDVKMEVRQTGVFITCEVSCTGKTGVEMEALTGVSVAALTIYDMCKAFGHEMNIRDIRLESKSGGKSDFQNGESQKTRE